MPRRASAYPTEAELEILNVLWSNGPSTVREVHSHLQSQQHRTALTTTLKLLQVMTDKGVTLRNDSRPHSYRPALPQRQVQAGLLRDMVERAFEGSAHKLLVRAVQDMGISEQELQEVRKLIDERRDGGRGD